MESPPSQPLRENRPSYPAVKCRLVVSHDSILTVRTGIGRVFVEVLRQADEGGRSRFRRLVLVMLNPHRRLTDSMPAMCLHVYRSRTTPIVIVERLRLDPNPMAPRASRGFVARILRTGSWTRCSPSHVAVLRCAISRPASQVALIAFPAQVLDRSVPAFAVVLRGGGTDRRGTGRRDGPRRLGLSPVLWRGRFSDTGARAWSLARIRVGPVHSAAGVGPRRPRTVDPAPTSA